MSKYFEPFFSKFRNRQLVIKKINLEHTLRGIWLPLTWPLTLVNSKIKCIRIQYWFTKIGTRLFNKSQTKNQNKFSIQLMGTKFIWTSLGINFRASFIQHLLTWLIFIIDDIDFASCADDNLPYTIGADMEDVIFKLKNSSQKYFFNGLWITKWKVTQRTVTFSVVLMMRLTWLFRIKL